MQTYSQNNEQEYILDYFKGTESSTTFLEIAHFTLLHSAYTRALIELGAGGIYVELRQFVCKNLRKNITKKTKK